MSYLSKLIDALKPATSWGQAWDNFQTIDPIAHGLIDKQGHLDDVVGAKVTGRLGMSGPADFFNASANDSSKSALHHALAGLAYFGASALGSGGGGAADAGMPDALGTAYSPAADSQAAYANIAAQNATNPALIDSALGTPGYGGSSASAVNMVPQGSQTASPLGNRFHMPQQQQQKRTQMIDGIYDPAADLRVPQLQGYNPQFQDIVAKPKQAPYNPYMTGLMGY